VHRPFRPVVEGRPRLDGGEAVSLPGGSSTPPGGSCRPLSEPASFGASSVGGSARPVPLSEEEGDEGEGASGSVAAAPAVFCVACCSATTGALLSFCE
jgi:hypothetical protein